MITNDFDLWLEFENIAIGSKAQDGFTNISIDLKDGRRLCLNIWTYEFVLTKGKREYADNGAEFLEPPDLLVKEFSRGCIHRVVEELIISTRILTYIRPDTLLLVYKDPWWDLKDEDKIRRSIEKQLQIELSPEHTLIDLNYQVIAKRQDCDDVLLYTPNGDYVTVHLTWGGRQTLSWPQTKVYKSAADLWENEMKMAILEF